MSQQHWQLDFSDRKKAELILNRADSSTNTLSKNVFEELDKHLAEIERQKPHTLVIRSAKKNGFCAGADIAEFTQLPNHDAALQHMQRAQEILRRLEALPCPSLCVIHGFCLGGGLEFALACTYRIAEESPATRIGLPEVKLGIHPGFAGSVRLTRLIGPVKAMPLILAGKTVNGKQACRLGIVSLAVPKRLLHSASASFFERPLPANHPDIITRLMNSLLFRPLLGYFFKQQLRKKVNAQHYPAPFQQIDIWRRYAHDTKKMSQAEARSVADLVRSPVAQNMIRLFFLQNQLKALGRYPDEYQSHHIHVIGAGVMGGDIAAWCACKGLRVTLQDQTISAIAPAIKRADRLFKRKYQSMRDVQHCHDRLTADPTGKGIQHADMVIEAIFENLEAKQSLFAEIEKKAPINAVLATNTSSLKIDAIAEGLTKPERLTGIHFFNPVAQMQLVETVTGSQTLPEYIKKASAFIRQLGKLPLPVKDSPGFLVNRMLMPYLLEAVTALDEGIPGPVIDQAAKNFGMPIGPVELADIVGLDICLHVANILSGTLDIDVPDSLRSRVKAGKLGKKTGEGYYRYHHSKPIVQKIRYSQVPADLTERLILILVNEGMKCLGEGVVKSADFLDAGIVFATGFAPFHGGPMQYVATRGTRNVLDALKSLEQQHGQRFKASEGWGSLIT